jgi:hypothetical protein
MIPIIGIMMAMYIITRMVDLAGDKQRDAGIVLQFFIVLTLLAAVGGMLLLIFGGFTSSSLKF